MDTPLSTSAPTSKNLDFGYYSHEEIKNNGLSAETFQAEMDTFLEGRKSLKKELKPYLESDSPQYIDQNSDGLIQIDEATALPSQYTIKTVGSREYGAHISRLFQEITAIGNAHVEPTEISKYQLSNEKTVFSNIENTATGYQGQISLSNGHKFPLDFEYNATTNSMSITSRYNETPANLYDNLDGRVITKLENNHRISTLANEFLNQHDRIITVDQSNKEKLEQSTGKELEIGGTLEAGILRGEIVIQDFDAQGDYGSEEFIRLPNRTGTNYGLLYDLIQAKNAK